MSSPTPQPPPVKGGGVAVALPESDGVDKVYVFSLLEE